MKSILLLLFLLLTSCEEKENIFVGMKIDYAVKLLEKNGWEETDPLPIGHVIHESYAKRDLHLIMVYDETKNVITKITLQKPHEIEYSERVRQITKFNLKNEETEPES